MIHTTHVKSLQNGDLETSLLFYVFMWFNIRIQPNTIILNIQSLQNVESETSMQAYVNLSPVIYFVKYTHRLIGQMFY